MAPPASRTGTPSFYQALLVVVLLCVLGQVPALFGGWILDDGPLIATNTKIHELTLSHIGFWFSHDMWDLDIAAMQADHLVYFRPLVMLSYALDWKWGAGSPAAFHVTNLALHAATVLLVGRALLRWTGNSLGSTLGAAYFGLHPARAESVAWVSGRPDVLAALGLLTCLEGIRCWADGRKVGGGVLFSLGLAVAFLSKETAVLLPFLVAVELAYEPGAATPHLDRRSRWPVFFAAGAAVLYLAARQFWLPMRPFSMHGLTFTRHAGFVLETLGRATMILLAPFDLSLSGPMLMERAGRVAPHPGYLLLGVCTMALISWALVWTRQRLPRVFWALLTFCASLLPTLNIVWIGVNALLLFAFAVPGVARR